jgi:hypothetical protein
VDTLTLSKEQKKLAEERIRAAGLQERIRVHLMDYRQLPPDFEKAFDAFVSIEMIEVCSGYVEMPPITEQVLLSTSVPRLAYMIYGSGSTFG